MFPQFEVDFYLIVGRHEIDTRTFTRPKKNKASIKTLTPIKLDVELLPDSVRIEVVDLSNKDGAAPRKEDDVKHSLAESRQPEQTCLKLNGPTNVQVVARMQEESKYCWMIQKISKSIFSFCCISLVIGLDSNVNKDQIIFKIWCHLALNP